MTRHDQRIISPGFTVLGIALVAAVVSTGAHAAPPTSRADVVSRLGEVPFHFEANHGQADARFTFLARGRNCNFQVAPTEALLTLSKLEMPPSGTRGERGLTGGGRAVTTRQLHFEFVGAARMARVRGDDPLPSRANYLVGADLRQWRQDVPLYGRVRVEQVYPGVDLVYYGNERRLEYDFVVAPQADPGHIAIRFTGADRIQITARGDLEFTLGSEQIVQPKPFVYQDIGGARKVVAGEYQLADARTVVFRLGNYDRELPLVIDPILSYSRFFGSTGSDIGWDIALSKTNANIVYVAGETMSANLPKTVGTNYGGGTPFGGDAFVARFNLDATNASPDYFTYLGGSGDDGALAIAVDDDGNAYVAGFTTSTNFPNQSGIFTNLGGVAHPTVGIHPPDGFVTKLGPDGSVVYSTYLGGASNDVAIGIAVNASRQVFVTGFTRSLDFPTNNAVIQTNAGNDDVFVAVLNPAGSALVYSTYLGGTNADHGEGIVADDAGNAYVTGYTSSTNFPVWNAVQPYLNNPATSATNHLAGANDAFLARLDPAGANLVFSTFFGGISQDDGYRIALDAQANVYICGAALSSDFPITATNFLRGVTNNSLADAFVAKFSSDGSTNFYSVQFGGDDVDQAWDVAVDGDGNAHVIGVSFSTNFPTADTAELLRASNSGGADVFLSVLGTTGTNFVRSALLGGSAGDFGYGIELNGAGEQYLVGRTHSTNFPSLTPFASAPSGTNDVFIAKVGGGWPTLSIASAEEDGVLLSWQGHGFQIEVNVILGGTNAWETVNTTPSFLDGTYRSILYPTVNSVFFRLRR